MIDPASFAARPPELPLLMTASVLIQARDPIRSSLEEAGHAPGAQADRVAADAGEADDRQRVTRVQRVRDADRDGRQGQRGGGQRPPGEVPVDLDDGGVEVAVRRDDARAVLRHSRLVLRLDDRDDQVLGIDFRRRVHLEHAAAGRRGHGHMGVREDESAWRDDRAGAPAVGLLLPADRRDHQDLDRGVDEVGRGGRGRRRALGRVADRGQMRPSERSSEDGSRHGRGPGSTGDLASEAIEVGQRGLELVGRRLDDDGEHAVLGEEGAVREVVLDRLDRRRLAARRVVDERVADLVRRHGAERARALRRHLERLEQVRAVGDPASRCVLGRHGPARGRVDGRDAIAQVGVERVVRGQEAVTGSRQDDPAGRQLGVEPACVDLLRGALDVVPDEQPGRDGDQRPRR